MHICKFEDCKREFKTKNALASHVGWHNVPKRVIPTGENHWRYGKKASNQYTKTKLLERDWDTLGFKARKDRLILEQGEQCEQCGYDEARRKDGKLILELHHKDGNRDNNSRKNLEIVCPNCHAHTDHFRFYGRKHKDGSRLVV